MLSIQPLRPIILSLGTRMAYVGFSGDHSPVAAPSLFRDQNYSSLDVGLWLRVLFATYLHIPPEAAKGRDLVIVEPVTCFPGALKNALMAAAFNCLQVGSVAFVEGMVMAATAAGIDAGLVIDLGWRDIVVGEVSEGRTGDTYCAGVGMRNVDAWIEEQLKTEDMGETLRAECCLALHCDTQGQPNGLAHGIEIPGRIRSDAITVLFDCEDRLSERNICETICRALRNASVAKRSILIRNIVFVGAGAMIPGFASRLSQELVRFTATRSEFHNIRRLIRSARFVPIDFPPVYMTWVGASALGHVSSLLGRDRILHTRYLEQSRLSHP